jgi:hypothetical protein
MRTGVEWTGTESQEELWKDGRPLTGDAVCWHNSFEAPGKLRYSAIQNVDFRVISGDLAIAINQALFHQMEVTTLQAVT